VSLNRTQPDATFTTIFPFASFDSMSPVSIPNLVGHKGLDWLCLVHTVRCAINSLLERDGGMWRSGRWTPSGRILDHPTGAHGVP
jgi:hypothetical protein